jgi:hypothetical protein
MSSSSSRNPQSSAQVNAFNPASSEAQTKRSLSMSKVIKKVAYSGLVATLIGLMSTVCSASAVWGS